jgi:hypothetical protein
LILFLIWLVYVFFPIEWDWADYFLPATQSFIEARSPYDIPGVYNPPWAFLFLTPLVLLDPNLGAAILSVAMFFSLVYVSHRLGMRKWEILALTSLPPVFFINLTNPNLDWLAALGFILPPQIGLFFVLIKPQIGISISIYWLVESWRDGGWREAARVFGPVTIAFLLSVVIYGPYFIQSMQSRNLLTIEWNYSLWPYSIPIGLALLASAIRKREIYHAILAGPFLSPYVAIYTWPVAFLGLSNNKWVQRTVLLGFWLLNAGIFMGIFN